MTMPVYRLVRADGRRFDVSIDDHEVDEHERYDALMRRAQDAEDAVANGEPCPVDVAFVSFATLL